MARTDDLAEEHESEEKGSRRPNPIDIHVGSRVRLQRMLRGISQEKLPLYLAFFQFVHNTRKRGKALLAALVETITAPSPRKPG